MLIGRFCLRIFEILVSLLMRAAPQKYRFRLAVGLVRIIPEHLRHTISPQLERRPGISSLQEAMLGAILEAMDNRGIRFDPVIIGSGFELVYEAMLEHRGVLLIGTHANGVL